ncbi:DUF2986 domain-containing protein [Shewanella mesophila]|uniref:DUF2986 domain-containing protein n=1 Tax=Shewanella mesophila TaxID=2864208 RepID=UPI001C657B00|nr:DUF2986 domain-containing protein [Shewanella mesophila]QYJ84920.1 DUF2986 domain-containing protein [Shewanella mesophila]
MNRKQKIIKKTAKRAKARLNKHTPPSVKKYVSKGDRAKELAREQAEMAAKANELAKEKPAVDTDAAIETPATDDTNDKSEA